jgi:hypothetical protein
VQKAADVRSIFGLGISPNSIAELVLFMFKQKLIWGCTTRAAALTSIGSESYAGTFYSD